MKDNKFEKKLYLSSPTMHGDELKYMQEAYYTNWMSTVGENINEIERIVSSKTGCTSALALGSGTSALHLAIKLAAEKLYGKTTRGSLAGKKVFCSDVTFSATVNPVLYEQGEPIFIDSEKDTWNMDPKALERAFELYDDVQIVIMVHLYGVPGKVDEILEICRGNNAILIEDAAESFGSTYKGKHTGTFGQYNCISFNGNKIITGSSGGMLLSNDEKSIQLARKWSTQSRENAPWYQHEDIGYNYRMSNVIAGVVRGQLPHLEEHIQQKQEIYQRYKEGFKDLPVAMNPFDEKVSTSNYWLSCILIDENYMCEQERTATTARYSKEIGKTCPTHILEAIADINAEGRPIWKPMHMQPIFENNAIITREDGYSFGADLFNRGLCLPSDNKMTREQQTIVIDTVRSCFE